MISKEKKYKTRDGREVRIYCIDGGGYRPVHGAIYDNQTGEWVPRRWTKSGLDDTESIVSDKSDLIEVKPRIQGYVVLRKDRQTGIIMAQFWYAQPVDLVDSDHFEVLCLIEVDKRQGDGL